MLVRSQECRRLQLSASLSGKNQYLAALLLIHFIFAVALVLVLSTGI
jgi:hypothetical protein